ncbi:AI-2E family transporter [Halomicroarcula limicola]|uniref:AI-2E family transporter n=1 Tax=Haloarcula limicola TaxID=1429915 RepID=A0A8J7Y7G0_9EURY|nr:AI-2E family transporter [Halomicroarcula limicola]
MRDISISRDRLGWWLLVVGLGVALAFVAARFVGILVLGLFGYYATRPISRRMSRLVDSDRLAATFTVLVVLLPILLVLSFLAATAAGRVRQLLNGQVSSSFLRQIPALDSLSPVQREQLRTLLNNPTTVLSGQGGALLSNTEFVMQVLQTAFNALLILGLGLTLAYVLLARDHHFSNVFVELAGGRETTAYAYAAAVDEDLESVFFGNLLFASIMAVIATLTYWATNVLAPQGLQVPMVLVLGFLTGAASLIPIVVGKIVYVPVAGYLGFQAFQSGGGGGITFVVAALVAYVLVLDLIPQAVIQPYVSGRRLDMTLLLFAYILGPMLYGWAGFFLFPILFVLVLEAIRIVLPELARGESPRPTVGLDIESGTDPVSERDDVPEAAGDNAGDISTSGDGTDATDPQTGGDGTSSGSD